MIMNTPSPGPYAALEEQLSFATNQNECSRTSNSFLCHCIRLPVLICCIINNHKLNLNSESGSHISVLFLYFLKTRKASVHFTPGSLPFRHCSQSESPFSDIPTTGLCIRPLSLTSIQSPSHSVVHLSSNFQAIDKPDSDFSPSLRPENRQQSPHRQAPVTCTCKK